MSEDRRTDVIENEVRVFLAEAADAWNVRNLERFMSLYVKDSDTYFINRYGMFEGEQNIRKAYATSFGKGSLRLYLTKIVTSSPQHLYVIGTYSRETGGRHTTGNFTLLLHIQADDKLRMLVVHES